MLYGTEAVLLVDENDVKLICAICYQMLSILVRSYMKTMELASIQYYINEQINSGAQMRRSSSSISKFRLQTK